MSEKRHKDILENANDLIHSLAPDGKFLSTNKLWRETLGYSSQEAKNMQIFDIVDPSCQAKCESFFKCLMAGNKANPTETIFIKKGGQKIFVEGRCNPKIEDGNAVELSGIFRDITSRKKLEIEKQQLISELEEAQETLQRAYDELEQRVVDRTAQLNRRTEKLMETNVALKIVLEKREEDKKELEEKVKFNVEKLISPYIEKLKIRCNETSQVTLLKIIQSNIDEITSSFAYNHKDYLSKLTPAQIQIADLIKQGQTTKEIALLLNLSPSTIAFQRQEIRRRLSLINKKINLQVSLSANS